MTAQVRIRVMGDEIDPHGTTEADATAFVPEPRQPAESESSAEHIVLGYN